MGRPKSTMPLRTAKQRYNYNKYRQLDKGWAITFEEWYKLFLDNGIDKNIKKGVKTTGSTLCLVRHDEALPYSLDNCFLATQGNTEGTYPCRGLGKERPNAWIVKDPEQHRKYLPWLRAKAQASFRGEKWTLSFKQFNELWGGLWDLRGRSSTDYCMTRLDPTKAWTVKNCVIVTRAESLSLARKREMDEGFLRRRRGPNKK